MRHLVLSWLIFSSGIAQAASLEGTISQGGNSATVSAAGALKTDSSATTQPVSAASLPLPSGASTAANQTTANTSLSSIDGKLTSPLAVTGTFFQATQPVSATALPLPAGASTSALQTTGNTSLASIDSKLTSPLAVTGTFFQATQPVSGTVAVTQSTSPWVVDGSGVTQPISATSLPLPSGAATSANQTTANTSLASIDSKLTAPLSISASSLPLPTGASTEATLSTLNGKVANDHGSSTGAVRVSEADASYADSVRNDYSSTNVTTGAWVQLIASTAANIHHLHIFDSCGETLELGTGAAASETRIFIIAPGGPSGTVDLTIPSGIRLAIRAISATCSTGELDITGIN